MRPTQLGGIIEDAAIASAPQLMQTVSIRTAISDDSALLTSDDVVRMIRKQPTPPKKPTTGARLLYALKPTFTLQSPLLGQQVFAPFGEARPGEADQNLSKIKWAAALVVTGIFTAGFVFGRGSK